ncbi:MAG TPA: permease, partial [Nannocystaceae bacterium]|nr:permease [Nannocystaceae bacterium]
ELTAVVFAPAQHRSPAGWVTLRVTDTVMPVLGALVAGFLCHVLLHKPDAEPQRTAVQRLVDLAAAALGVALPLSAAHSHGVGDGGALRDQLTDAWVELVLETAPMLLLGLVLGALLQVVGSRIPGRWLTTGGASRQAVRGIAVGAPLPLCACGVLPIAEGLRARGAGPALVVAFLVSTPELGPEAFTLSVRFLGWPFAIVRIVAALLLAYIAGVAFARFVGARQSPSGADAGRSSIVGHAHGRAVRSAWAAFDELLLHTAPWTVVGLLAAAYIQVVLPPDALAPLAASGVDVLVIAMVAMPMYVCAASTTPMAAVLLAKGVSPGAVLVGMLLGPATNVATVGVLGRAYGGRATALGLLVVLGATCALGFGLNGVGIPVALPPDLEQVHEHGVIAWVAIAVLAAGLGVQLWRGGIGPWLEILDAGHEHRHGDGHTHAHGHDHG